MDPGSPARRRSAARANAANGNPRSPRLGRRWWERILFGRVSSGQLAQFCRQFGAYLDAGVDLIKALASLEKQFERTALGPVTGRLHVAIRRGDARGGDGRRAAGVQPVFLSMIKVAEARGGVPETLRMLAQHYEARQSLIRQARSAMIYPIIVLLVATAAWSPLITIWLLPMFISMLKDSTAGTPLPLPTRVLMAFSDFMQTLGWWLVPLVLIGGRCSSSGSTGPRPASA